MYASRKFRVVKYTFPDIPHNQQVRCLMRNKWRIGMNKLTQEQREILMFVHQHQHEASLGHRQAILNAFSLTMTGLMAMMAGAIAIGKMSIASKLGFSFATIIVCTITVLFIRLQRQKSEEAMKILRSIEGPLGLYEKNAYLSGESVLPESFTKSQKTWMGFTKIDRILTGSVILLSLSLILVVVCLPGP